MSTMQLTSNGRSYSVERQSTGVYRVQSGERFLGFVERAGSVYVALAGTRYDRAVEAGQALSLSAAVALLKNPQPEAPAVRSVFGFVRSLRSVA
jgi:hypothetical protein